MKKVLGEVKMDLSDDGKTPVLVFKPSFYTRFFKKEIPICLSKEILISLIKQKIKEK